MRAVAREHAGEAADTLRAAAGIDDPYLRADAIWEALERVRCAAEHLFECAADANRCNEIAHRLEEGCEGNREPLGAEELRGYARTLDFI
jgi:hypothetical protein